MKMNIKQQMQGFGFEIVKVLFLFSLAIEALIVLSAAWTKDLSQMPYLLLLLMVPVVSVLARRLVRNFVLFFLLHLALFGAIFLYDDLFVRVIAGAFIASDVIYIYVRKTSGINDPMTMAQLGVAFGLAIVIYYSAPSIEITFVRPVVIAMFIIHISVYMIYFHQMNIRDSLSSSVDDISQSARKINRLNSKIIIGYIVVMLILIGAGVLLRMDIVISGIGQLLLMGLRVVMRFLFRGDSPAEITSTPGEQVGGGGDEPMMGDIQDPYLIWLILEKIVMAACIVFALVLLGYVLYRFYQKFSRDRVEEVQLGDYEETTLFVEKAQKMKKERRSLREYFTLTNDKKVRRLYQKKVEKQIKAGVPVKASQTVQEIRQLVRKEDLTTISSLYEKARYSEQPISREEVKSIE